MIRVDRVHLLTDAPLGEHQARSLGKAVVTEMNAALKAARTPAPHVHIDELQLTLPSSALANPRALASYARSVAQRILDQTPE